MKDALILSLMVILISCGKGTSSIANNSNNTSKQLLGATPNSSQPATSTPTVAGSMATIIPSSGLVFKSSGAPIMNGNWNGECTISAEVTPFQILSNCRLQLVIDHKSQSFCPYYLNITASLKDGVSDPVDSKLVSQMSAYLSMSLPVKNGIYDNDIYSYDDCMGKPYHLNSAYPVYGSIGRDGMIYGLNQNAAPTIKIYYKNRSLLVEFRRYGYLVQASLR